MLSAEGEKRNNRWNDFVYVISKCFTSIWSVNQIGKASSFVNVKRALGYKSSTEETFSTGKEEKKEEGKLRNICVDNHARLKKNIYVNLEVKFTIEHVMKAKRGSGFIPLLFL